MNGLIVFARAPVTGKVKTRLLKDSPLNETEVCELYRAFLCDTLSTADKSSADKIIFCFEPKEMEEEMRELAEKCIVPERLIMDAQAGESFHEKISASFKRANEKGASSLVMIGSDSPTLQYGIIDSAFEFLLKDGRAVLGPSGEGGIYLIGINAGYEPDFEKIFGDSAELSNFAKELKRDGVSMSLLQEVTDVDVASDLVTLLSLLDAMQAEKKQNLPAKTIEYIEKLGLRITRNGGTRDKVITKDG